MARFYAFMSMRTMLDEAGVRAYRRALS